MIHEVTAAQMVKSIQAQRDWKPETRPWETVKAKRDVRCVECGRIYLDTKREICASCHTATMEEICR